MFAFLKNVLQKEPSICNCPHCNAKQYAKNIKKELNIESGNYDCIVWHCRSCGKSMTHYGIIDLS